MWLICLEQKKAKMVDKHLIKDLWFTLAFSQAINGSTWARAQIKSMRISIPIQVIKARLLSGVAWKHSVKPMMKFSQLICWVESRLEPKLNKKSGGQISGYFRFHNFLVLKKTVLQILIWLCINVKIWTSCLFLKLWGEVTRVDFEKNVI